MPLHCFQQLMEYFKLRLDMHRPNVSQMCPLRFAAHVINLEWLSAHAGNCRSDRDVLLNEAAKFSAACRPFARNV